MWPFSKPQNYLGVDIGSHGIKLAELAKKNKRAHLFTYAFTDKELFKDGDGGFFEVNEVAELLKKMCQEAKVTSKTVLASLPVSNVFSALITIPLAHAKKSEERAELIRHEAEKLVPLPLAEMVLDWKIIKREKAAKQDLEGDEVLFTAAPKKLIASYSETFRLAGLTLLSLESEAMALINALIGKDPTSICLIDMGATRTDFFIVERGVPVIFHSITFGGRHFTQIIQETAGVGEKEAEQIKHDLVRQALNGAGSAGFPPIFEKVIPTIVEAVKYSFEIYSRQRGEEGAQPEKIILTGGSAMIPHLDSRLAEIFNLKVYLGDPWARVIYDENLKPVLDEIGPRFAVAIGLALKKIENVV